MGKIEIKNYMKRIRLNQSEQALKINSLEFNYNANSEELTVERVQHPRLKVSGGGGGGSLQNLFHCIVPHRNASPFWLLILFINFPVSDFSLFKLLECMQFIRISRFI